MAGRNENRFRPSAVEMGVLELAFLYNGWSGGEVEDFAQNHGDKLLQFKEAMAGRLAIHWEHFTEGFDEAQNAWWTNQQVKKKKIQPPTVNRWRTLIMNADFTEPEFFHLVAFNNLFFLRNIYLENAYFSDEILFIETSIPEVTAHAIKNVHDEYERIHKMYIRTNPFTRIGQSLELGTILWNAERIYTTSRWNYPSGIRIGGNRFDRNKKLDELILRFLWRQRAFPIVAWDTLRDHEYLLPVSHWRDPYAGNTFRQRPIAFGGTTFLDENDREVLPLFSRPWLRLDDSFIRPSDLRSQPYELFFNRKVKDKFPNRK